MGHRISRRGRARKAKASNLDAEGLAGPVQGPIKYLQISAECCFPYASASVCSFAQRFEGQLHSVSLSIFMCLP